MKVHGFCNALVTEIPILFIHLYHPLVGLSSTEHDLTEYWSVVSLEYGYGRIVGMIVVDCDHYLSKAGQRFAPGEKKGTWLL